MLSNIDTEGGLAALLISYEIKLVKHTKNLPIKQLIRASHLLMKHNMFRFGNTYYRQKDGTAIGAPPATDWATQMFAFYEMTTLQDLFGKHLRLNKRFVANKIGPWKVIPNGETYSEYKTHLNKVCKLN